MSYKTDIENNNQRLEINNQDIDNIIQQIKVVLFVLYSKRHH